MAGLVLEIVEGAGAGRQVQLESVVDMGRDASLPLALDQDGQVSRRHARVTAQGGQAVVEDLGSTNGTYVNDQEVHGPRIIAPGDKIRVGLTVIELRTAQQIQARPSAVIPTPQFTQVGDQVLAPVPEQQLAPVAPVVPAGPVAAAPVAPGIKAQETPPAFVPPEVVGDAQAESDYQAIARLVDTRVKQQRNVAAFAMLATAALAVIIYFGVT
jgi:pSer/pThr/pTyr-binding forkhead associated (FHA) protein